MNYSDETVEKIIQTFDTLVNFCGMVTLDDAYAQFKEWFPEATEVDMAEDMWDDAIVASRSMEVDFRPWQDSRHEYAIHEMLYFDLYHTEDGDEVEEDEYGQPVVSPQVEGFLHALADCHDMAGRQPLSRKMMELGYTRWGLSLPEALELMEWLAERLESDYAAEDALSMVAMLITGHQNMDDASRLVYTLHALGLPEEFLGSPNLLDRMMQLFNALPSWKNNGLSAAEMYAKNQGLQA